MKKVLTIDIIASAKEAFKILKKLGEAFKEAFKLERATVEFKYLLGNIEAAKQHVAELREMGQSGAFGFDELAKASKILITFSDGVLNGKNMLSLLSDVAAATGQPLNSVTQAVAKFYDKLANGEDISKATKALQNAGVISQETASTLVDMQNSGEDLSAIWETLTDGLEKFNGVNTDITNTAGGQVDLLKNRVKDLTTEFAENFTESIKTSAPTIIEALNLVGAALNGVGSFLGKIAGFLSYVIAGFGKLGKMLKNAIPGMAESDWNDQLAENIMRETDAEAEKKRQKEKLDKAQEAINKAKEKAEIERKEQERAKEAARQWERDTKAAQEAERRREKAVRELNQQYQKQKNLVKSIEDSIISTTKTLQSGYASVLTTTGKMGGYQSATEATFATKMPGQDPQLDELRKQTTILQKLEQKLPDGSTFN